MKDDRWLALAEKVAALSEYKKWRTGAVIVRGGSVLALGTNKLKNSPLLVGGEAGCSTHAEADALSRCQNTKNSSIYVCRLTPTGSVTMAKPCKRCMLLIEQSGIRSVKWTDWNTSW